MSDDEFTPKFALSEGAGEKLSSLPCFTNTPQHGNAAKALEAALEPLHRLVYGRQGVAGTRRSALVDFRGFPAAMREVVHEKLAKLTKDRLRDIVKALRLAVLISQNHGVVAASVADFFMVPSEAALTKPTKAETKRAAAKKETKEKSPAHPAAAATEAVPEVEPPRKKAKAEAPSSSSTTIVVTAPAGPSDDAVLVEVYRRVLAMTYEERAVLGVKALRTHLEEHFHLPAGGLKAKKDIITTAASECVQALREAEERATTSAGRGAAAAVEEPAGPAHASAPMHPGVLPQ